MSFPIPNYHGYTLLPKDSRQPISIFGEPIFIIIFVCFVSLYQCDDEIQSRPKAFEVLVYSQRDPFEHQLDGENDAKREVRPVQRGFERFVLVQVNVLEAQRDARRED